MAMALTAPITPTATTAEGQVTDAWPAGGVGGFPFVIEPSRRRGGREPSPAPRRRSSPTHLRPVGQTGARYDPGQATKGEPS